MSVSPDVIDQSGFQSHQLVTWRYRDGNVRMPVPAVVVRQLGSLVVIKARIQGVTKEYEVTPDQLDVR
ncbi:hypothetical protein [Tengunoibacter tsumagoiensis]|uniref:Uncharacterized protein n=1 Tax=Tengunoibacter tsumagoiensis TaxID=2014871 RepID=A0A402A1S5_9CHLR|nr:hypothetical protein [Tengunoibacter tsumagoiensis]GCE12951.1 hypothetical protein KTT_28100 [Tengunoibacter tsumagoiensis]